MRLLGWTLSLAALLAATPGHAAEGDAARVATLAGVALRDGPSPQAAEVGRLGLGDGLAVIATQTVNGTAWVKASVSDCVSLACEENTRVVWVPEQDLALAGRFQPLASPAKVHLELGAKPYLTLVDLRADGSYRITEQTPDEECDEGRRREAGACVVEGRLMQARQLVWAKGADRYFFVNAKGQWCSAYTARDGEACAKPE